jgi:hypothetical protein
MLSMMPLPTPGSFLAVLPDAAGRLSVMLPQHTIHSSTRSHTALVALARCIDTVSSSYRSTVLAASHAAAVPAAHMRHMAAVAAAAAVTAVEHMTCAHTMTKEH